MNIFKIEQEEVYHYCYIGHVIVARSEQEVRDIAKNKASDEGQNVWNTAKVELCGNYTGDRTESFIIMSDYWDG